MTDNYDYEGYEKSLEKILDGVTKDYWVSYIDVNRHQVGVGRMYLWVAAALIGTYATSFQYFSEIFFEDELIRVTGYASFFLAVFAFGTCLYSIPVREGYRTIPIVGWGEFSQEAYGYLEQKENSVYLKFLSAHISKVDESFAHNFNSNLKRAFWLRLTSWVLLLSFSFAIFTSIIVVKKHSESFHKEQQMSENKPTDSGSSSDKPNIPPPPPPATVNQQQSPHHTHSEQPSKDRTTHIFDNADKKRT